MKGPKGLLSEAIANALGEYFLIEPKDVETNLVSDAGVTLHHVQLKPIESLRINDKTQASIHGTVDSVAFHWQWGSDNNDNDSNQKQKNAPMNGKSSWVKNAQLSIEGLVFSATLSEVTSASDDINMENVPVYSDANSRGKENSVIKKEKEKHDSKSASAGATGIKGYMQDQVNRIIDALTLSVKRFEFKIVVLPRETLNASDSHLNTEEAIIFGGSRIELESLGRHMEELQQTLTIQNVFSNVISSGLNLDGAEHTVQVPFLDPISYSASCIRCGGKRFDGGVATGVRVVGTSTDNGIVVHAGATQILFLNRLTGILIHNSISTDGETLTLLEETETRDALVQESRDTAASSSEHCEMHSSYFELPLAALSLVLPNETKLSMAGLVIKYQMDGHLMMLEGTNGFKVNDFPLLAMGESCLWQADIVNSQFRVYQSSNVPVLQDSDNDTVSNDLIDATVHVREDEIDNIKDGVFGLLDIYHEMESQGALADLSSSAGESASATRTEPEEEELKRKWSFAIDGRFRFLFQDSNGGVKIDSTARYFKASMEYMNAYIGSIERLYVPGSFRLKESLENTTLSFDGSIFDLQIGDIVACLEEPPEHLKPDNVEHTQLILANDSKHAVSASSNTPAESNSESSPPFVLPFGGTVSINCLTIFQTDGETNHSVISNILLAFGPDAKQSNLGDAPTGDVRAVLMVEDINHDMIHLEKVNLSGVIHPYDMTSISHLECNAYTIAISAGYSVWDWVRLLQSGDEKRETKKNKNDKTTPAMRLPCAHVCALKVKVVVKGAVGVDDTTLHIKEFNATDETTTDDLIRFYSSAVLKSAPGVVTNASVIGFNLKDAAANHAGIVFGTGALAGLGSAAAPAAGVLGIIGFDAVKNTINAGKKKRGVEADDKMKVTDFFRGIGQVASDTQKSGAAHAGKGDADKANAIDWAVGATTEAAEYTNENKARLGGAGAGTAGFMYGMFLGGPVGAVAGAIIASKATSHTIEVVDQRLNKEKLSIEEQPHK
eukprot:CAMPEP_0198287928 /NCGR_PEP_ID=MMETSP1449-20131203/6599_1 /TAXON_ID=420275 /ORGANISM="Attheya septentrionalis, Strain CCMP2084" /LENGTH=1009 /DNA_ID=CAMNT_0043985999 /DNA_START=63 /DNA_END=3092 /DNA_ORIENTATION=+